ncbi:MAG TPA: AraC family transcriptional regulator [Ferruginibacter sp.]|jgi:AraC-like DNA-binding protein|nr:AraC family transcriptional regulator [Ferruginibacter sp.]
MLLTAYDIECLQAARKLIDENTRQHHSIAEIAHSVGMGATRLKAGFKQHYGFGLYAYLREQRMLLAVALLQDRHKTIKAIAKETGFVYVTNFSAAFKRRYGMTAGKYRKTKFK